MTGSTPKLFPIVLVRVSVSVSVRDTTSVITHHTSTYVSARSPAQMLHEQPQHLSVHHVRLHVYSFLSSLLPVSLHYVFKSVEVRRSGRRSPDLYVMVQTACSKYREVWVRLQYVNLKGNKKQRAFRLCSLTTQMFYIKCKYHEKFYN